jgi:fimbrial chaperone protein
VQDFEPSGRGTTQTFRLENAGTQRAAVEISIHALDITPDGEEKRTRADGVFNVFPSQIVLPPRGTQVLRVQWRGPAKLEKELVYRLIAEQLPVELQKREQSGARINILLRYEAILYVVPKGAKGELRLVSTEPATRDGKPALAISIENRGNAHGRLVDPKLELTAASGQAVTLGAAELTELAGVSVLAGRTRHFRVPWPPALPVGPVTGRITFEMER